MDQTQMTLTVSEPGDVSPEDAERQSKVADFLSLAQKRFRAAADAESKLRREQLYDKRFRASEQWEPDHVARREADKRPCLTINRLPGIIRQVTNQARQLRPAIQVNPVDSGSDLDTAEVLQGIIRHIEINSDAEAAYMTGQENQAEIGRGYWRILTEYENDESFDQVLKIKRIPNPFAVYFDPSCVEADYSDARYAFIVEDIPRDEYRARYPKSDVASLELFSSIGDRAPDWAPEGRVRIAEYYYVEVERDTVILIEIPPDAQHPGPLRLVLRESDFDPSTAPDVKVLQKREILRRQVKWAKISGSEIIDGNEDLTEGRDWPGQWIPIIPVIGEEININGEVDLRGMVRDARGPQRMLNFWASSIAESVGTAPRPPYMVEVGQVQGLEEWWNNLNIRNYPYLPYKGRSVDGRLVPAPQRQVSEPPIQAMVQGYALAENELKAVTGLYDPSLGAPGNERSGKAILARQQRGDLGTSNYQINFARAIRFTGQQLVDLIPRVYDSQRILRILGVDDQPRTIMVHAGTPPLDPEALKLAKGLSGIYDISVGQYDVTVSTGPSYQSRRQESSEAMIEMVRAYPQAFPVIGDLLVENMDWPGARQISTRLKKMLDPRLQEDPSQTGEKVPVAAQQQIIALTQQLEQATAALQQSQQIIATDAHKLAAEGRIKQMELESRERVAAMQTQADLVKTQAELNAQKAETMLKAELDQIKMMLESRERERDRAEQREERAERQEGSYDE